MEVDLGEVRFLDSTGIRVLCQAADTTRAHGGSFRVVGASGPISRTLEIAGVAEFLRDDTAT